MRKHCISAIVALVMAILAAGSVPSSNPPLNPPPAGAVATSKQEKTKEKPNPKSDDEIDEDGLVLLTKSVQGNVTNIGLEITGTVVNRRSKALGYTQITFNVYDESGAQIGTALANINGLEPGGRWNFKAVSFTKGTTYKFSKLSGF